MSDSAQSLWPQAGYAQLKQDARGHLTVTDDFLRVLLLRPELAPIESSCKNEIQIHERLLENPRLDLQASVHEFEFHACKSSQWAPIQGAAAKLLENRR